MVTKKPHFPCQLGLFYISILGLLIERHILRERINQGYLGKSLR